MRTILLIDDERNFLKSLADALKDYIGDWGKGKVEDWNIVTAENGKQGTEVLDSQQVDLVVTDLRMPLMDGFELLSYVRRKSPRIPVIVMTASDCADLDDRLAAMGAAWCLRKPFKISDMAMTIAGQLA